MTVSPSEPAGIDKEEGGTAVIIESTKLITSSRDLGGNIEQNNENPSHTPDEPVSDVDKAKAVEESRKLIADLLTSKKYNLPIKEKRLKPLVSFSLGFLTFRKHKKSKTK